MSDRLAEILLQRGAIDDAALARAQRACAGSGERLATVLSRLGILNEGELASALAEASGLDCLEPDAWPAEPLLRDRLTVDFLRRARVLPIAFTDRGLRIAVADPGDGYGIDAMRMLVDRPVVALVAPARQIERAIERLYGAGQADETAGPRLDDRGGEVARQDADALRDAARDGPAVRFVRDLLRAAVEARASDLHIEPRREGLRTRMRIDGALRDGPRPPDDIAAAVIGRIKVLAGLDLAERRRPQDGRTRITEAGEPIDMRISVVPMLHGEGLVLRLLNRAEVPLRLDALGFAGAQVAAIEGLLAQPHGLVLVTGPTGSGKTTTLYAALAGLLAAGAGARKIVTIEDPVEFELAGINQIQVRDALGLGFAALLRAVLRHDPDIILVGEIRDAETARTAIQAALTGHLVLATLHTNDAAGAVARLRDMGIESYLIAAVLRGALAQRLLRRLCANCARALESPPAWLAEVAGPNAGEAAFHAAAGCDACAGTGYRGRLVMAEAVVIDDALRAAILADDPDSAVRAGLSAAGHVDLRRDGFAKAAAGLTAAEEVLRVTLADGRPG